MLADYIAKMIEEMLNEEGGTLELQRNEMASRLGCVPSQISYVISSRFTPERGYIIESRRGGGGCIRIIRKEMGRNEYLMHFFCAIGRWFGIAYGLFFFVACACWCFLRGRVSWRSHHAFNL